LSVICNYRPRHEFEQTAVLEVSRMAPLAQDEDSGLSEEGRPKWAFERPLRRADLGALMQA
jgi:hypothetical protein